MGNIVGYRPGSGVAYMDVEEARINDKLMRLFDKINKDNTNFLGVWSLWFQRPQGYVMVVYPQGLGGEPDNAVLKTFSEQPTEEDILARLRLLE